MESILIVDDHTAARNGMANITKSVFPNSNVMFAETLEQSNELMSLHAFDLLILDMGLPDGNGDDFVSQVQSKQPNCYVVMSTIQDEGARILNAFKRGAKGYLLKEQTPEELKRALEGIATGKPPLAPSVARRIISHLKQPIDEQNETDIATENAPSINTIDLLESNAEKLTQREREILGLYGKGFNRPEIAGILEISKHTVATHVSTIYEKLGIENRSEATMAAQQLGML